MKPLERWPWITSAGDRQELAERYDMWAEDYDDEHDLFGYLVPRRAVEALMRYVPQEAGILDAGAGSDMVGELLSVRGYHHLEALDMSKGMLEQARRKNIYTGLHQMILGEPLDFPSAVFDAVISVGAFGFTHTPANTFDELIRITRPEGIIVFTMRKQEMAQGSDFNKKLIMLQQSGKWELIDRSEPFIGLPKGGPGIYQRTWTCRVQ